jgi:hypothetical protein
MKPTADEYITIHASAGTPARFRAMCKAHGITQGRALDLLTRQLLDLLIRQLEAPEDLPSWRRS